MSTTQLSKIDWKRVGIGGALYGVTLAAAVLITAYAASWLTGYLGWPEYMRSMTANAAVGAVSLAFILPTLRSVFRLYTSDDGPARRWFTTDEVAIYANGARRRHYYKQVAKVVGGGLFALMGGYNAYSLVTLRPTMFPEFVEMFGESAAINYQFMTLMMAAMVPLGLGIAARAWLNRYQDLDDAIVDGMERGGP